MVPVLSNFKAIYQNRLVLPIKNLSEFNTNNQCEFFFAVCVPKDSDGDGIPDQVDIDSDNDGIPVAQVTNFIAYTSIDLKQRWTSDAYGTTVTQIDTDNGWL
jgi:hypothetical protein